jgi:hypothetical protein
MLPTLTMSSRPTSFGTPTVGMVLTMSPTIEYDDGFIYGDQDNDDAPHTPNWDPYTPLTDQQYAQCTMDLQSSDIDGDSRLNYNEYLSFLSLNSAGYGYTSLTSNATTLSLIPMEFALIFHSTSCLCSYFEEVGCCLGDREGVRIFYNGSDVNGNVTAGQVTGGGSVETIDVGGGETDDYDLGGVVISTEDDGGVGDNMNMTNGTNVGRDLKRYKNARDVFGDIGENATLDVAGGNGTLDIVGDNSTLDVAGDNSTENVSDDNSTENVAGDNSTENGSSVSGNVDKLLDEETYARNFCTDGEPIQF